MAIHICEHDAKIQRRMHDEQWDSQLRDPRRQVVTPQVVGYEYAN
ncbi:hypothetical protein [Cupriavidus laharis]|nr:hypothetical protein [Cupriavidus laharis]